MTYSKKFWYISIISIFSILFLLTKCDDSNSNSRNNNFLLALSASAQPQSKNILYVTNNGSGTVTYFNATTGAYINGTLTNSSFTTGSFPSGVTVWP